MMIEETAADIDLPPEAIQRLRGAALDLTRRPPAPSMRLIGLLNIAESGEFCRSGSGAGQADHMNYNACQTIGPGHALESAGPTKNQQRATRDGRSNG